MPSYAHIFLDKNDKVLVDQLTRKLNEYEHRLQEMPEHYRDTTCKILILKTVLRSERRYPKMKAGVVFADGDDFRKTFRDEKCDGLWQSGEYFRAFLVISEYVHGRSYMVTGGTGLPAASG